MAAGVDQVCFSSNKESGHSTFKLNDNFNPESPLDIWLTPEVEQKALGLIQQFDPKNTEPNRFKGIHSLIVLNDKLNEQFRAKVKGLSFDTAADLKAFLQEHSYLKGDKVLAEYFDTHLKTVQDKETLAAFKTIRLADDQAFDATLRNANTAALATIQKHLVTKVANQLFLKLQSKASNYNLDGLIKDLQQQGIIISRKALSKDEVVSVSGHNQQPTLTLSPQLNVADPDHLHQLFGAVFEAFSIKGGVEAYGLSSSPSSKQTEYLNALLRYESFMDFLKGHSAKHDIAFWDEKTQAETEKALYLLDFVENKPKPYDLPDETAALYGLFGWDDNSFLKAAYTTMHVGSTGSSMACMPDYEHAINVAKAFRMPLPDLEAGKLIRNKIKQEQAVYTLLYDHQKGFGIEFKDKQYKHFREQAERMVTYIEAEMEGLLLNSQTYQRRKKLWDIQRKLTFRVHEDILKNLDRKAA
ncbi:MAG: hypothetical protein QE263_00580 [Vampirovibrionales bacterium]|nr:hypothetical protein [Vampirovibrionales bacterium]